MVLQRALDSAKDRPKDEKKVIAGGIAIFVVVALFFGWAIFFLKKIQSGEQRLEFGGGAQDEFLPESVRQAQQNIMEGFSNLEELEAIRNESTGRQVEGGGIPLDTGGGEDPFGTPGTQ